MKRFRSQPFYAYHDGNIARHDPQGAKKSLQKPLTSKIFNNDDLTPKRRHSLSVINPQHLYLNRLLEPLHQTTQALQSKMQVLHKLWAETAVSSSYYQYFLKLLKQKPNRREQYQLIVEEIQLVKDKKLHYYFNIRDLVNARQSALGLILGYFTQYGAKESLIKEVETMVRAARQDITVHFSKQLDEYTTVYPENEEPVQFSHLSTIVKHIKHYRQLTIQLITLIFEWQSALRKGGLKEHPVYLLDGQDYFEKVATNDSQSIFKCSILFEKHPLMMVLKEHEKDPLFSLLFRRLKPTPIEANEILRVIEILSRHQSNLLKIQLSEAYNRELPEEPETAIRKSLIERLYGGNFSPPLNYLDRKHPVYIHSSLDTKQKIILEKIRHKKSLIVQQELPANSLANSQFKSNMEVLSTFDQKLKNRPQPISDYKMLNRDYLRLTKVKFDRKPEAPIRVEPNIDADNPEREESHQPPPPKQHHLTFQYVQMEQDQILEFLQNLKISKIDKVLRIILSNLDCSIIKICDDSIPGRNNLVALLVCQPQQLPNGKQQFQVLSLSMLIDINKDLIVGKLSEHVSHYNRFESVHYNRVIQIQRRPSKKHMLLKVTFMVDKKHKKQAKSLMEQYNHLKILYKNRNEEGMLVQFDEEQEKYVFEYAIHFPIISIVKMTAYSHCYYKIKVDRLTKLKEASKVSYKLVIFGIKEVLVVGDADVDKAEVEQKLSDVDVLIPAFSIKMKYIGSDSDETLFKEHLWFQPAEIVPEAVIKSKERQSAVVIESGFTLSVLNREGEVMFYRKIQAN